jgi:hypothetical protein
MPGAVSDRNGVQTCLDKTSINCRAVKRELLRADRGVVGTPAFGRASGDQLQSIELRDPAGDHFPELGERASFGSAGPCFAARDISPIGTQGNQPHLVEPGRDVELRGARLLLARKFARSAASARIAAAVLGEKLHAYLRDGRAGARAIGDRAPVGRHQDPTGLDRPAVDMPTAQGIKKKRDQCDSIHKIEVRLPAFLGRQTAVSGSTQ